MESKVQGGLRVGSRCNWVSYWLQLVFAVVDVSLSQKVLAIARRRNACISPVVVVALRVRKDGEIGFYRYNSLGEHGLHMVSYNELILLVWQFQ